MDSDRERNGGLADKIRRKMDKEKMQSIKPKIVRQVVSEKTQKRGGEIMETVKLTGEIHLVLKDKHGRIKEDRLIKNTITTIGKATLASLMVADVGETGFDYIAIGVGTPGALTLGSESSTNGGTKRGAANVTGTVLTTTTTNDTGQWVTTFTFTGALVLTEAGIFNASGVDTGDMLASQNFSALNVADTDTLQITWKIKVA